ncbi:MAG: hypothetical protein Q8Q01_01495 [archaeon]|nr:hypothetical protein [archaeon]
MKLKINRHLKTFLDSFKLDHIFWKTLLTDVIAFALIIGLFLSFGSLLTAKAYDISGGLTVEQLKTALLSGSQDYNKAFSDNVRNFLFIMVGGSLLIILLALAVYSFSRMVIWDTIMKKHTSVRSFLKWNLISLLMIVTGVLYSLLSIALKSPFVFLTPFKNQVLGLFYTNMITAFFMFIFLVFMFLAYKSFAKSNKVWESIGMSFHNWKKNWSLLSYGILLMLVVMLAANVISYLIQRVFIYQPKWILTMIGLGFLLIVIAWARLYVARIVKG